jgi:plasmid stabilization system protein ParE
MMDYHLQFHPLANEDYKTAFAWYENVKEGLGERFAKAVRSKLKDIMLQPKAYSSKGNIKFREAKIDFFPYLIVFKIKVRKKQIFIGSVHHTKKSTRTKYRK